MKLKTSLQAVLFLMLLCFAYSECSAQGIKGRARFTTKKRYVSFGGMITTANFMGDLSPVNQAGSIDWGHTKFQFGGFIQKRMMPRVTARLSLNNNIFSGSDKDAGLNADRGLEFSTYAVQLNAMGIVDLFPNSGVFYRRPKIPIPYLGLGIGFLFSTAKVSQNPAADYQGTIITGTQTVNSTAYVIPVALGVRYKLTSHLDIAFEATANYTGSDKIDGIDREINSNPSQSKVNDAFLTLGFQLNYIIGGSIKMPKFR
ncbi:DUF6089 family protein [Flammeovirga sp. SJP92]|uniref:DUF6089 family protein n=1 Tax=Flammeovirga sp. SJP92 TaxID=1775430 RepID=UPI00078882E2|nr:DUF6089 family protein [Flammeovirga sp. SJP92]KXX70159.1 hypothetical protein AVL50_14910 [Flammeovirga sp. SJP92]